MSDNLVLLLCLFAPVFAGVVIVFSWPILGYIVEALERLAAGCGFITVGVLFLGIYLFVVVFIFASGLVK